MFFSCGKKKVCRYCNGTREEISTHFNNSAFECRTVFSYNNQSNIVEEFPQYSTVYGIKSRSPLNELQNFHIIGRQPFDIYHDIYEGLAVDVLSLSIEAFVKARYFSIDILNDRIKNFSYAMFEKTDKPQIITKTGSWDAFRVRQQAVEMSNLLRIFPLLVGDLVPDTDFKWGLLISFFQLVQALASPIFSTGSACYLAGLVEDFLKDFHHEFNISVKPKNHYLVHYPAQIVECGPPVDHDTVRFEGKHHYFTEIYNRSKNRVNICKSMATRHQFLMHLHYSKGNILAHDCPIPVFSDTIKVSSFSPVIQSLIANVTTMDTITVCRGAKYQGFHYRKDNAIATGMGPDMVNFG